jgi:hypothetical protein
MLHTFLCCCVNTSASAVTTAGSVHDAHNIVFITWPSPSRSSLHNSPFSSSPFESPSNLPTHSQTTFFLTRSLLIHGWFLPPTQLLVLPVPAKQQMSGFFFFFFFFPFQQLPERPPTKSPCTRQAECVIAEGWGTCLMQPIKPREWETSQEPKKGAAGLTARALGCGDGGPIIGTF